MTNLEAAIEKQRAIALAQREIQQALSKALLRERAAYDYAEFDWKRHLEHGGEDDHEVGPWDDDPGTLGP